MLQRTPAGQAMQMANQMANSGPYGMMQGMVQNQLLSNPMFQRAQQMAQGKSPDELRQTAQNLCQNMGIDFEQAIQQFKSQLGQ